MASEEIFVKIDVELKELAVSYLENRRKEIPQLKEALEKQDFEQIRTLAHRMKGSGGGYGFDEITEIGRAMEEAAKQRDGEKILQGIQRLEHYLTHVRIT